MQPFVLTGERAGAETPAPSRPTVLFIALGLLTVLFVTRSVLPGSTGVATGVVTGIGAVLLGVAGLLHHSPARHRGWWLVLAGTTLWVLGDLTMAVGFGPSAGRYPAIGDLISLAGYPLLGAGALDFCRARGGRRDLGAVLDALIITTSVGVTMGVFLVAPLAESSSLPLGSQVTGFAFPLGDLFLLGLLGRMYTVPAARTPAYLLLVTGFGLSLAADTGYDLFTLITSDLSSAPLIEAGRLGGLLLIAWAACTSSMRTLADPDPTPAETTLSRRRQAALMLALLLPNVVLLADGFNDQARHWELIAAGLLLICVLILVRILRLISTVQDQAVRLGELARSDGLTGAPNRRTWDYELDRATTMAREHGTALCVAMLDLDRFKAFNDSRGHQAGDLLLRDSVALWTAELRPPALLARYGGEEFALLAPGLSPLELATVLERLRTVTPFGQTFSAGVAQWDPQTDPGSAVAAADEALYAAKRAGRNRVVIAGQEPPPGPPSGSVELSSLAVKADPIRPSEETERRQASRRGRRRMHQMPNFSMVTQPIVDLRIRQVCAHEALARFDIPGTTPETADVFRKAHRDGFGDLLELAAIQSALDLPGRPLGHDLYVNASARALISARLRTGLPANLSGVVIELSEDPGDVDMADLLKVVNELRERGARIALDDIGAGSLEFARLALLTPDMVKIDRSLVVGCASDAGRTAVLRSLVTYIEGRNTLLCAEGAETAADLNHLAALGVTHAQGNVFAAPKPGWHRELGGSPGSAELPERVFEQREADPLRSGRFQTDPLQTDPLRSDLPQVDRFRTDPLQTDQFSVGRFQGERFQTADQLRVEQLRPATPFAPEPPRGDRPPSAPFHAEPFPAEPLHSAAFRSGPLHSAPPGAEPFPAPPTHPQPTHHRPSHAWPAAEGDRTQRSAAEPPEQPPTPAYRPPSVPSAETTWNVRSPAPDDPNATSPMDTIGKDPQD